MSGRRRPAAAAWRLASRLKTLDDGGERKSAPAAIGCSFGPVDGEHFHHKGPTGSRTLRRRWGGPLAGAQQGHQLAPAERVDNGW